MAVITELSSSGAGLQSIAAGGVTWLNVERPTDGEVEHLTRQYGLLRSDVGASLDRTGPAGVWQRADHAVVTVQVPVLGSSKQGGGRVLAPVTIFVGHDVLVTIHTGEVRQLNRLYRQFESDDLSRDEAFATGVAGVVFMVIQRLIDATAASRATIERAIVAQAENASRLSTTRSAYRETIVTAARLRADARSIHRVVAPLPSVVRALSHLEVTARSSREGWDRLISRVERLALSAEQDLAAIDGIILDATAIAQFESARSLRVIAIVATLTLPVATVLAIMTLPSGNPLASLPNAFPVAVAIAGAVFLVALFGLRRRGMI